MSAAPTVNPTLSSDPVSIIGARKVLCQHGEIGGTNGDNYWTVGNTKVPSVDISELTNQGNSDTTEPIAALCASCSCGFSDYFSVSAVGSMVESELERTGFASFIVPIFVFNDINFKGRLCYGLENWYVSVLVIGKVEGSDGERVGVSVTVTSAQNRTITAPNQLEISERNTRNPD